MFLLTLSGASLLLIITLALFIKSLPALQEQPFFELLFSSAWKPMKGKFGFMPFISGTVWVTAVSLIVACPFSILAALYISEYASGPVRNFSAPVIDILAGIPSVVYGIWGVLTLVPFVRFISENIFGTPSTGYCVLSAGLVLAVMVVPIITHVSVEVLRSVPRELRDVSLALGATKWQTVKKVVLRKALPGMTASVILGVSRAFGETMAVLMVAGNVAKIPDSIFSPAYPLPALIANNYGEMLSIPLYDSILLFASLLLLVVVIAFNAAAKVILVKIERKVV